MNILKHKWHDFNEGRVVSDRADNDFIALTIKSANPKKWPILYFALISENDAVAMAKHFGYELVKKPAKEYMSGELIETAANLIDSLQEETDIESIELIKPPTNDSPNIAKANGFMSEAME